MRKHAVIFVLLLFSFASLMAQDIEYTNSSIARLSYVKGNSYIQRSSDLAYEEGVVNMPVGEGDRIGTTDGHVEIYLRKGIYFRLDNDTKVDFMNLPKKGDDLSQIRLWSGNIYLSIDFLEREKSIEVHTADVSIYILDEGLYRINVRPNQETEIFVFNGLVEASGTSGSVLIKEAHMLEAIDGQFSSNPLRFYATSEDNFDIWSEYRDSLLRKRLAQTYLPDELGDFEHELQTSGEWTNIPPYGRVWVPGGIGSTWRPYYDGRWVWMPTCGWTWLPYETWGWVTFHFGRWHWNIGVGWYWIPTTIWGPGWVSWHWGYDYCGWAPMSYYGYPGVIVNNIYYGRYTSPYYPAYSRALTVVRKDQLQARRISRVALSSDSARGLGKIQLTKSAPSAKATRTKLSIEKLNGNKVFLHRSEKEAPYKSSSRLKSVERHNPESVNLDKTSRKITPFISSRDTGKSNRQKTGYPSSDQISRKSEAEKTQEKSTQSTVRRFYDSISKEDSSKTIKSRTSTSSSQNSSSRQVNSQSSSQRVKSRSTSRPKSSSIKSSGRSSSRSTSRKSSSRPKSSSKPKSSSSSSKTKKKK
ncbi:DUF6600 domain-containing protein [Acidobacteriota bacterium]